MSPRPLSLIFLVALLVAAVPALAQVRVEQAFPNLTFSSPIGLEHAGDGTDRLYIVEQGGRLRIVENDPEATSAPVFLDLTDRVRSGGEMGLLGLAFHPDYAENGYLYVNYTTTGALRTRISRFSRFEDDDSKADPASEIVLLEFAQPYTNHNGGGITFGPDGYLYIAVGDGGSGGDPQGHGQNPGTLLGSVLRIDVDGEAEGAPDCGGEGAGYTVPENALADGPGGACDEIFSYGLRNPWRISFDRETGELWAADVGQNAWEEINILEDGGNFGWNVYEGNHCYSGPCDPEGFIFPVWEYSHALGCSITGGYVYRGQGVPELVGKYVYGDYCSGRIWALSLEGLGGPHNEQLDVGTHGSLTSFGQDEAGELYFVRTSTGKVYVFRSDSVGGEAGAPEASARLELAGPNPSYGGTALAFALPEDGPARLVLHDVLGREVARLFDGPAVAGQEQVVRVEAGLAAGLYVARLEGAGRVLTHRLVLLR